MAVLIVHPTLGIYLGNAMGLGFWSHLDPCGQDAAVAFPDEDAAQAHTAAWNAPVAGLLFLPVEPDQYGPPDWCWPMRLSLPARPRVSLLGTPTRRVSRIRVGSCALTVPRAATSATVSASSAVSRMTRVYLPRATTMDKLLRAVEQLLQATRAVEDLRRVETAGVSEDAGSRPIHVIHDSVVYRFPEGIPAESSSTLLDVLQQQPRVGIEPPMSAEIMFSAGSIKAGSTTHVQVKGRFR